MTEHGRRERRHLWFAGIALMFTPLVSMAGAGWTNAGTIVAVVQEPIAVDANGGIYIGMSGTTTNPSGCSASNSFFFTVVDDRTKRMYATLLSAQLTGKTIQVYVTGTCGMWGFAQIDGLLIQS
jgi:hypothetical protein